MFGERKVFVKPVQLWKECLMQDQTITTKEIFKNWWQKKESGDKRFWDFQVIVRYNYGHFCLKRLSF